MQVLPDTSLLLCTSLNKFYNSGNCKTVYEIQQIKESPEYH